MLHAAKTRYRHCSRCNTTPPLIPFSQHLLQNDTRSATPKMSFSSDPGHPNLGFPLEHPECGNATSDDASTRKRCRIRRHRPPRLVSARFSQKSQHSDIAADWIRVQCCHVDVRRCRNASREPLTRRSHGATDLTGMPDPRPLTLPITQWGSPPDLPARHGVAGYCRTAKASALTATEGYPTQATPAASWRSHRNPPAVAPLVPGTAATSSNIGGCGDRNLPRRRAGGVRDWAM